jgi:hypothetical protein
MWEWESLKKGILKQFKVETLQVNKKYEKGEKVIEEEKGKETLIAGRQGG